MNKIFEITIPVLNEEETLESKIIELKNYLEASFPNKNWRIIIADNGSTDNTPKIGDRLSKTYSEIAVIKIGERGVGLALKQSWSKSNADILGSMDLDLSTDIKHISEAIDKIVNEDYDLVYGSRLHKNSTVIGRTLKRETTSRLFNFIVKTYLNVKIADGMCGFAFFKRDKFHELTEEAKNNKWFFQTEILVVAEWLKLKIFELPVKWTDDQNSKVKILSLAMEYLKAMRLLKKRKKYIYINGR